MYPLAALIRSRADVQTRNDERSGIDNRPFSSIRDLPNSRDPNSRVQVVHHLVPGGEIPGRVLYIRGAVLRP